MPPGTALALLTPNPWTHHLGGRRGDKTTCSSVHFELSAFWAYLSKKGVGDVGDLWHLRVLGLFKLPWDPSQEGLSELSLAQADR